MIPNRPGVPPVSVPASSIMYGSSQSGYTMAPPMSQQFVPATMVYPTTHMTGMTNNIPLVTPTGTPYQRVYVPVQQMPMHPYASVPAGQLPAANPPKSLDERRKLEKERNFQWQQQRLKQFTIASKKGSMNADTLLDSMFGKPDVKKTKPKSSPIENCNSETKSVPIMVAEKSASSNFSTGKGDGPIKTVKPKIETDPKKLENMMLQCSSLSGPQKAKGFQKPSVKEISPVPQMTTKFSSSQKSINWKSVQGLENVFAEPQPKFPPWCNKESVPPLYHQIEKIVTNDYQHLPDTNLLFPILLSSGLSQKMLGDIWELVNTTTPGQLASEEMYAALALIALVQNGYQVSDVRILHQLPTCPIPVLQCFQPKTTSPLNENSPDCLQSRPGYISLNNSSFKKSSEEATPITDDEFDDFKSATPVAVNVPPMVISDDSHRVIDDSFDDFKQAEPVSLKFEFCKVQQKFQPSSDLMSQEEDKYSVFRVLQSESLTPNEETHSVVNEAVADSNNVDDEDEFGDFLGAGADPSVTSIVPEVKDKPFTPNFADFSKFDELPNQVKTMPQSDITSQPVEDNEEFGDFATFQVPKSEVGQEFIFPCPNDNISLTETQSISSLEFPSFDGLKSSLSRQGSIPSLDLRCTTIESGGDGDDGFGELQSAVTTLSISPTPSTDTNKSNDKSPSSSINSLPLHPVVSLNDKYSVIRSEQIKFEDEHLSSWTRCLEGCLTILQKSTRIFNQMSCSSVCHEVLSTEEGKNYVKNVIEVYLIVCRINLASKSYGKSNNKLQKLIEDADKSFHTLAIFLTGSPLLPEEKALDFSLGVLKSNLNGDKACGVCLLNVDSQSKSFKTETINKLVYGGRNYHSPCANLWVNYVDPLLPALTLPQLL